MPTHTKHHRFLLSTLFLGHLTNDWVSGTLWFIAPAIAASMGLGPIEVGLILTVNGIGAGLAYIPAGMIADRSSRPGYLLLLTFWWVALGYLSATLVPGFWAVTLLLAFGVMGDAVWHPVATGVLVKAMPERRAHALGIHAVGGSIGAEVLGPLATGFLLGYFDWQTSLQILVLPAVIMGLIFIPVARRITQNVTPAKANVDFKALLKHWSTGTGIGLMLMMIFYNMALMAILGMTPLYLQSEHAFSPFYAGLIFATLLMIGALCQPVLGHYTDRRGRKAAILLIFSVAACFAFIAGVSNELVWAIAGLLPATVLLTAVRPAVLAAAVDFSTKSEATTLGIVFTVLDGVGMAGALFAGLVAEVKISHAFILAAMLAMFAAVICVGLKFKSTVQHKEMVGDE
ncbi:MAG: MFS transporter [Gammaproteobacteria bacterium]|nr:MFS transporter [Gammaproteobacteria bacterium]